MLIRLSAQLGTRRGESSGLRWRDLHGEAAMLTIRTGIVDVAGTLIEKDTKTHATRPISIDAGTVDVALVANLDRATFQAGGLIEILAPKS